MKKIIFFLITFLLTVGMCFAERDSVSNVQLVLQQDAKSKALHDSIKPVSQDSVKVIPQMVAMAKTQETTLQQSQEKAIEQSVSEQIFFLIIAVIVLAALLIALFVFVVLDRRNLRNTVIDIITDENNIDDGNGRLQQWLNNRVNRYVGIAMQSGRKPELQELLRKIDYLNNRIEKIEQKPAERPIQTPAGIRSQIADNIPRINETPAPSVQVKKLYALNIIDGFFNKVSEQLSGTPIFELTVSPPNSATFTVYKGAYATILAAPEYLEGCDKQTLSDNPVNLHVVEGKAILSDGKWKIIQKANVKLV